MIKQITGSTLVSQCISFTDRNSSSMNNFYRNAVPIESAPPQKIKLKNKKINNKASSLSE